MAADQTRERRPLQGAAPNQFDHDQVTPEHNGQVEWRVSWHREGWGPNSHGNSRKFARRRDLDYWLRTKLLADNRPELSRVIYRISWRHVGPWHDGNTP